MISLVVLFAFLLLFYSFFLSLIYRGLNRLEIFTRQNIIPNEFISVIIPFRNEENSIIKSLESLEKQKYDSAKFEVIYINDKSEDNSLKILQHSIKKTNIKVISVPDNSLLRGHKKKAIEYGIRNSQGEIVVTTDADCTHNENWLSSLVSIFDKNTGFVSGPVEFNTGNSFFKKLQRLEFASLIITGAGLIGSNKPTICNAANLAFRKSIFYKVNGYSNNLNISSGDDEFLMHKIHKETNMSVKFCADRSAMAYTEPNKSISQFYQQRKRWASKGLFYSDKFLVLKLIFIYLFYLGLVVQPVLGFVLSPIFFVTFGISFFTKVFLEYLIVNKGVNLLFHKEMMKVFMPAEILHVPYILLSGISGAFGNYKWKDREVER